VTQGMEVPDNSLVIGVPGTIRGEISPEMKQRLQSGNQAYARLLKRYQKQPELKS